MFVVLFIGSKTNYNAALIVFIIAATTDALDGWIARKLKITSKFGEHFDPLADKFLSLSAFVAFAIMEIVPIWCVSIIAFRDIFTTFLRYKFFSKNKIPTSKTAKAKTVVQFVFISFILVLKAFSDDGTNPNINCILDSPYIDYAMYVITAITVWTMIEYISKLKSNKKKIIKK
jgi:CDP-diacylglycerol--glycerol-3-phosphate 3-phosphatidyltransferase